MQSERGDAECVDEERVDEEPVDAECARTDSISALRRILFPATFTGSTREYPHWH